jgi:hypothetical protein
VEKEGKTKNASSDVTIAPLFTAAERTVVDFDTAERTRFMCPLTAINHLGVHARFPTAEDIKTALSDCPDFAPMYNYLRTKDLLDDEKTARRITYEAENFVIENDLLFFYTLRARVN